MKPATLSLAAFASIAAAQKNVTLVTESSDAELSNKGLYSIHEGAGINGVYLATGAGAQGETALLNTTDSTVYTILKYANGEAPITLGELDSTLVIGVAGNPAKVANNYVTVNGSADLFYACKPLPPYAMDPYKYSSKSYGVGIFAKGADVPSSCKAIKIAVHDTTGFSNSTTNSTTNGTAPAGNATTVTSKTTAYTTIPCSTPTTFAYNGKTYTVTSATTLTVEDCGCTETPSAVKPTPKATKAAGNGTSPAPVNGAAAQKIGAAVAGVAAAALLL